MSSLFDQLCAIYKEVDEAFKRGDFDWVESQLRGLDPHNLEVDIVLAWVCATFPGKDRLTSRKAFMERAPEALHECFGNLG
jgi:hypothetical protein